jgi:hypothetical protein
VQCPPSTSARARSTPRSDYHPRPSVSLASCRLFIMDRHLVLLFPFVRSHPLDVRSYQGSSFRCSPLAHVLRTAFNAALHRSEENINPPGARITSWRVVLQALLG